MPAISSVHNDDLYLKILLDRIRVCRNYKPKFGQGQRGGLSLAEFKELYSADPFYSWFGLDNPMMYAAHSAAGGITSVYRQIGIGCEELVRRVLQDCLGLNEEQANWSYEMRTTGGRVRRLSLDARVQLSDIRTEKKRVVVSDWLHKAATHLQIAPEVAQVLKGSVFEVRQGYKSKDSKRQNADIANAAHAYSQGYLPVVMVLSTQIDSDIAERYEQAKCLVLKGYLDDNTVRSTYAFFESVIGYDLAQFFQRNTDTLKASIQEVLEALLKPYG